MMTKTRVEFLLKLRLQLLEVCKLASFMATESESNVMTRRTSRVRGALRSLLKPGMLLTEPPKGHIQTYEERQRAGSGLKLRIFRG